MEQQTIPSVSNEIYTTSRESLYEEESNLLRWKSKKTYNVEKTDAFLTKIGLQVEGLEQMCNQLREECDALSKELMIVRETGVAGAEGEELLQRHREIEEMLKEAEQMREAQRTMLKTTQEYCEETKRKAEQEAEARIASVVGESAAYLAEIDSQIEQRKQYIGQLDSVITEKEMMVQATVVSAVEDIQERVNTAITQIRGTLAGRVEETESISS